MTQQIQKEARMDKLGWKLVSPTVLQRQVHFGVCIGCYILRPFPHPVARCCVLLVLVEHKFETGQTFSYVQTDATTPNNLGSCWLTMLRLPSARSLTLSAVPRFEWQTRVPKQWKSSVKKFSCVVNLWGNDVSKSHQCWELRAKNVASVKVFTGL